MSNDSFPDLIQFEKQINQITKDFENQIDLIQRPSLVAQDKELNYLHQSNKEFEIGGRWQDYDEELWDTAGYVPPEENGQIITKLPASHNFYRYTMQDNYYGQNPSEEDEESYYDVGLNDTDREDSGAIDLDQIIAKLVQIGRERRADAKRPLSFEEIRWILAQSREIFLGQSPLIELNAPIKVCGDIHGQFYDLIRLFDLGGYPPESNFLFLGDYVDRGRHSIETMCLLLAYKIKYPENFFLLRGNHEAASINRIYGFYDECKRRYSVKLWKLFTDCFNCLPLAAIIEQEIFCMHGGLSPFIDSVDQIRDVPRPIEVPTEGFVCDLLWADPDPKDGWNPNDRGVSFTFGRDIVADFLEKHHLSLICRAHQVVEDGYEFFADRRLVTIFSAPNYADEFDNAAAIMTVDENLMCSFLILPPFPRSYQNELAYEDPVFLPEIVPEGSVKSDVIEEGSSPDLLEGYFWIKDSSDINIMASNRKMVWCTIRNDKLLYWKESQRRVVPGNEILKMSPWGSIDLREVLYIDKSTKEPIAFIIALQDVTYHMKAEDEYQANRWVDGLTQVVNDLRIQAINKPVPLS